MGNNLQLVKVSQYLVKVEVEDVEENYQIFKYMPNNISEKITTEIYIKGAFAIGNTDKICGWTLS